MFALNQGGLCPSRALIQESTTRNSERALKRVAAIKQGNRWTPTPCWRAGVERADPGIDLREIHGARAQARGRDQASAGRRHHAGRAGLDRAAGKIRPTWTSAQEGAQVLAGGARAAPARWSMATSCSPRCSGPQQDAHLPGRDLRPGGGRDHLQGRRDALSQANDTLYGRDLGGASGRATRSTPATAWAAASRPAASGPTATAYPAHAAFGGYKQSGIGRENHKMMLQPLTSRPRTCW